MYVKWVWYIERMYSRSNPYYNEKVYSFEYFLYTRIFSTQCHQTSKLHNQHCTLSFETDVRFCQMDPCVEVGGWRVFLFLHCSDGISVALLDYSLFDTCTVGLIYTAFFYAMKNSLKFWPITLMCSWRLGAGVVLLLATQSRWKIGWSPFCWLSEKIKKKTRTKQTSRWATSSDTIQFNCGDY